MLNEINNLSAKTLSTIESCSNGDLNFDQYCPTDEETWCECEEWGKPEWTISKLLLLIHTLCGFIVIPVISLMAVCSSIASEALKYSLSMVALGNKSPMFTDISGLSLRRDIRSAIHFCMIVLIWKYGSICGQNGWDLKNLIMLSTKNRDK